MAQFVCRRFRITRVRMERMNTGISAQMTRGERSLSASRKWRKGLEFGSIHWRKEKRKRRKTKKAKKSERATDTLFGSENADSGLWVARTAIPRTLKQFLKRFEHRERKRDSRKGWCSRRRHCRDIDWRRTRAASTHTLTRTHSGAIREGRRRSALRSPCLASDEIVCGGRGERRRRLDGARSRIDARPKRGMVPRQHSASTFSKDSFLKIIYLKLNFKQI